MTTIQAVHAVLRYLGVVVERLLDVAPVVLEPPHPVGGRGENHEADEPLHREHAQDQLVAQFPAAAEAISRSRRSGSSGA
jgi:hypothetical protein